MIGERDDAALTMPRPAPRALPDEFVRWQLDSRRAMLERIGGADDIPAFGAHLPVLVTFDAGAPFPAQTANKGAGFTPADEFLEEYVRLFRETLRRCEGRPQAETRAERLTAIRDLYDHPERMDLRRLGLLEIFEGKTYRNVRSDPRVALHYTDVGPRYRSYQVNGWVEIAGPGDPRYEFVLAARLLFEYERFHIHQPAYPWAYVLWVAEVYDKTPRHGRAGTLVTPASRPTRIASATPAAAKADGASGRPPAPRPRLAPVGITRPGVTLRDIVVALDNSPHGPWCMDVALQLGRAFGSTVYGEHVYAARLHDERFDQMEDGLPSRYRVPEKLDEQRRIHESLITKGLEVISDSYLAVLERRCREAGLAFIGKRVEGRNYAELARDLNATRYDLAILGARGLGATEDHARDVPLGSVCERVLRRAAVDVLVVRDGRPVEGTIAVAVDGSPRSFGAVRVAAAIARALGARVEAVAAYDPHFHRRAFRSLEGVLSEEAGRIFRFREQERLHEEIIDSGIARIYRDHLETASRVAAEDGVEIATTLLEGKPYTAILAHLERSRPSLLVVGRTGVHAAAGLDIGSNAEELARLAPCHVLVAARGFRPGVTASATSEDGEALRWTPEALASLDRVPAAARAFAGKAIEDFARRSGANEVTPAIMREARDRMGMP